MGTLGGEKRTRRDGCELSKRMLGTNSGPLGKQHLLLTAKPSLPPIYFIFKSCVYVYVHMSHYLHVSARTVEARRHGIPEDRMGDHEIMSL